MNDGSANLLLLKVHLYQDYNSSENKVSSIYGMANINFEKCSK